MKRSTKIIGAVVLSISLVTAAGAYATYNHGNGEAHAAFITSYISSELALDDTQQLQLTALSEQVMSLKDQFNAQGQPLHQELEKLLSADTFDQQKALNMISDKTAFINQAAPEVIAAFAGFLDGLNTEQKAEVMEFINDRHQGRGQGWKSH